MPKKIPKTINPLHDYIDVDDLDDPQREEIVHYNRALRQAKIKVAHEHFDGEHHPKRNSKCPYCEPFLRKKKK